MRRLETKQEKLNAELVEAGSGGSVDHGEMARRGQELSEIQTELAATEEQWLELSTELEDRNS